MNSEYMAKLANTRMPFGKYKNRRILEIPESYLIWFARKGFPKGELGNLLGSILEIKLNGLEYLLETAKK